MMKTKPGSDKEHLAFPGSVQPFHSILKDKDNTYFRQLSYRKLRYITSLQGNSLFYLSLDI